MQITIAVVIIFLLIFLGMGIPFCFLSGALYYAFATGFSTGTFVSSAFFTLESSTIIAIPMFFICGTLIVESGIARTLIDVAEICVRRIKGGLAGTIVLVSCFFGALSGSGTATCTTIATMMFPRLKEKGWDPRYLAALIAASAPFGYMIPPNVNAILYSSVASTSVSQMFLSTIVPAVIWAGAFLVYNRLTWEKHWSAEAVSEVEDSPAKIDQPKSLKSVLGAALPAILFPVIIMGGIYGGIFTATEAGAVGCLYAIFVGVVWKKAFTMKKAYASFRDTAVNMGVLMLMLPMAMIFSRIMVAENLPAKLSQLILSVSSNKYIIILLIDIVLFVAGMFIDTNIILLVFTPLLLPICSAVGVSSVQLGCMMFVAIGIGTITPPMSMGLYIVERVTGVKVQDQIKPLLPLIAISSVVLLLVSYIPFLSEWLPGVLY